jgi:hypothetical protein
MGQKESGISDGPRIFFWGTEAQIIPLLSPDSSSTAPATPPSSPPESPPPIRHSLTPATPLSRHRHRHATSHRPSPSRTAPPWLPSLPPPRHGSRARLRSGPTLRLSGCRFRLTPPSPAAAGAEPHGTPLRRGCTRGTRLRAAPTGYACGFGTLKRRMTGRRSRWKPPCLPR